MRVAAPPLGGLRSQPDAALRRGQHQVLHGRQTALALLQGHGLQQLRELARRSALRVLTAACLVGSAADRRPRRPGHRVATCGSCGFAAGTRTPAAGQALAVEPPVPAPAGLLAERVGPRAGRRLGKIERGVSGAVALLPPTAGEVACGFAGLDSSVARLIDGGATSYAVLGEGSSAAEGVAWVVALPLTDWAAASAMLLVGGDAAAPPVPDVAGMKVVSSAGRPATVAVAPARGAGSRGWLVLASSQEASASFGPYAVRTMPTKAAPTESAAIVADVPQSALAGPVPRWLGARWAESRAWLGARDDEQRAKHGGRAPDFGDPRPLVEALDGAVTGRIALLPASRGARVVVDAGDDDVHVELTLTPAGDASSTSAVPAMVPGDALPLARRRPTSPSRSWCATIRPRGRPTRPRSRRPSTRPWASASTRRTRSRRTRRSRTGSMRAETGGPPRSAWGLTDASRGVWLRTPAASAEASSSAVRELVDLSHRSASRMSWAVRCTCSAAVVASTSLRWARWAWRRSRRRRRAARRVPAAASGSPGPRATGSCSPPGARPRCRSCRRKRRPHGSWGTIRETRGRSAALGESVTLAVFAEPLRFVPRGPVRKPALRRCSPGVGGGRVRGPASSWRTSFFASS